VAKKKPLRFTFRARKGWCVPRGGCWWATKPLCLAFERRCVSRWWWCQTDGSGGQKSPSVLLLNEEGVVVGKRAPPSRVRAKIPPSPSRWFSCAGHVGNGGGVGGKGLTLSQRKGRPSPSRCSSSCFEQRRGLWWPRFSSISRFE